VVSIIVAKKVTPARGKVKPVVRVPLGSKRVLVRAEKEYPSTSDLEKDEHRAHGCDDVFSLPPAIKHVDVPGVLFVLGNVSNHLCILLISAASGKRNGWHNVHANWLIRLDVHNGKSLDRDVPIVFD
jgi:hypothetical protein